VGGVRDARHTCCHERPGSGHETADVVADIVDTFITVEQAHILVDWVAASGKNLRHLVADGMQKLVGWFGGPGLDIIGRFFVNVGIPARNGPQRLKVISSMNLSCIKRPYAII
jgi:hypothetical protein